MGKAFKLSALKVSKLNKPGIYGDGAGLCLRVTGGGSRHWVFRFMLSNRAHWMGLGPYPDVTLEEAREQALEARRKKRAGVNPIGERKLETIRARATLTFQQCADKYIASHRTGWKNSKHANQWTNTLSTYCGPVIGGLAVNEVDVALVMKILEPIWVIKAETASRLRGRIESILDWAAVRGYRQGNNPARWKGHLNNLLPKSSRVKRIVHHASLSYTELGAFMAKLSNQPGIGARALAFVILTAARSGEVRGTTWDEIDMTQKLWVIPGIRMKSGKEHRVPLSRSAISLLKEMKGQCRGDLVFPGRSEGRPLSDMSLIAVLHRMNRKDLTCHGFRATFRDWVSETTAYPREVAEMALAHTIGDKVEAAYRRGDLFTKRTKVMEEWDKFCNTTQNSSATVIPLKKNKN